MSLKEYKRFLEHAPIATRKSVAVILHEHVLVGYVCRNLCHFNKAQLGWLVGNPNWELRTLFGSSSKEGALRDPKWGL